MIYPLDLFFPDPITGGIRPSIIFIAYKPKFDSMKALAYGSTIDLKKPEGGFSLPFPNGGLVDASENDYGSESSILGQLAVNAGDAIDQIGAKGGINGGLARVGKVPDPRTTQVYKGTSLRSWEGEWQIIPQSMGESAAAAAILWWVKFSASPDRAGNDKAGLLIQPHVYKIIFSNPVIHLAMQFDQMALKNYSINYFANNYASTYSDMMPKHMSLTLSFSEFGIKTKKDWITL